MTDPTARQGDEVVAETENGQGNGAPGQDPTAEAAAEANPVTEAKREAAEFKDKLLRTLAEMENLRKRTEREVADARLYGIAGFAREVLAVADNMHRALEAIGPELREHPDAKVKALIEGVELTEREVSDARLYGIASFAREVLQVADNMHRALEAIGPELREHAEAKVKALIEGVELTERELLKALEKHGVKKFSPLAEKFDPNVHQAMFELESVEVPPGHVGQVIQAGYMIGDRVLRPALVAVAKAAKAQSAANDNPSNDA